MLGTVTQYISTGQPGTTIQVTNVKPVAASSIAKSVPATGRRVSHPETTTLQSPTTPSAGYTGVVGAYMQVIYHNYTALEVHNGPLKTTGESSKLNRQPWIL